MATTTQRRKSKVAMVKANKAKVKKSPFHWEDYQKEWFQLLLYKDLNGILAYLFIFTISILFTTEEDLLIQEPVPHTLRTFFTLLFTAFSYFNLYIDIFQIIPPTKKEPKYVFFSKNIGGHFSFLTVNILVSQCFYWTLCSLTEVNNKYIFGKHFILVKIYNFCLSFAVFSTTTSLVMAILFLKLVYFEPLWRKTVLEKLVKQGYTTFPQKTLFVHLSPLIATFIDLLLLKDQDALNQRTLNQIETVKLAFGVTVVYYLFTRMNYFFTNDFPYPVLHKVVESKFRELAFIAVVAAFVIFCSLLVRGSLALEHMMF
eukprot:maker-scaffold_12-snap-gene-12.4-mRNA-1 protein AED:0.06 eAED:0.06 QI:0/0/0.5/0.5/0/0/2/90/314